LMSVGCGLLTGWDRIHFPLPDSIGISSCGLLTGWDRIHYPPCDRCCSATLRLAHRLGSDTLKRAMFLYRQSLRLAHRLGSDTLAPQ